MSIDKIKERIKMIENNDFTTTGETVNEAITGNQQDIEPLFQPDNSSPVKKVLNKIRGAIGLRDRDPQIMNALSKSDSNTREIQAAADQLLRGGTKVNFGGDYVSIPQNNQSKIFKIYDLMKTHKVLTNELDSNYKPKYGYYLTKSPQSQVEDTLVLDRSKLISIQFSDEKLTNVVRMNIKNNRNFNQNDFQAFFNDLDNNKKNYGVRQVALTNSGRLITIDF